MIRRLFIINLKAFLSGVLRMRRIKTGAAKQIALAVLFVFIFASIMISFGSMFFLLCKPLFDAGIGWFYFSLQAVLSFVLSVFGTIFSAQTLFKAKDNELLLSMPIRPFDILISRFLVILLFEYIFELIIAIPAFTIWIFMEPVTLTGVIFCVIGYALLPLMALSVACLIAWVLSAFFTRFKHTNIFTLVISVTLLWLYLRLYSQLQTYINMLLNRGVEIAEVFRKALPPFYAFGSGIANHNIIDAAMFYLWAIIPFILTVAVIMVNYQRILTTNKGTVKTQYREKAARVSSACFALTKKELTYYASKPMVILNTSISSFIMVIGTVMIFLRRAEFFNTMAQVSAAAGGMPLSVLAAGALAFMGGINNLSASLISLEGKRLWIAKTIPVQPKIIYLSKIYTHLISSAAPCLIVSVSAVFFLAKSVTDGLIIILLPQTYIFLVAVAGLSINLIFPRFDWLSEIQPVKQGAAAMIVIFGSMIFIIALFTAYIFIFRHFMGIMAFAWVMAAVFAAAALLLWGWLSGPGAKKMIEL